MGKADGTAANAAPADGTAANAAPADGTAANAAPCRECLAGRPHCHGTLIHHGGQSPHCTEPGCGHPEVLLHSLTVDCEAIGCDCGERGGYWVAI